VINNVTTADGQLERRLASRRTGRHCAHRSRCPPGRDRSSGDTRGQIDVLVAEHEAFSRSLVVLRLALLWRFALRRASWYRSTGDWSWLWSFSLADRVGTFDATFFTETIAKTSEDATSVMASPVQAWVREQTDEINDDLEPPWKLVCRAAWPERETHPATATAEELAFLAVLFVDLDVCISPP
jgi:hypothetical protein